MEIVANGNKLVKQSRVHFTRSSKTKSFNHCLNHHKNQRICRSNSLRSSFKHNKNNNINKNNNKVQLANFVNDNGRQFGPECKDVFLGDFTREVYNAICVRLGDTLHIPEDSVQALFNDMQLFPSKSQVSKMLQCARQCGRRNGATNYITYGEFCVFASEMRNQNHKQQRKTTPPKTNKCPSKCDVFLGGSCNPTTWRTDTAIPELKKHGITYYNPQVSSWAPELVAQEYDAKQRARVLLFVLDSETRSTVGMVEVAFLVAAGRRVVVVVQPYKNRQTIMGETVTDREYRDLVNAQSTLLELVKNKGVKIHTSLPTALQCTANILRNTSSTGTSSEDITVKLRKLREVYESYGGDMKLHNVLEAYEKLTNKSLEIRRLYNYLGANGNGTANAPVTFERFCALMAEFSCTEGCGTCSSSEVWATQPFQRQCSTNNNTCHTNNSNADCSLESPVLDNAGFSSRHPADIFLGGSLSTNSSWRTDVAIPLIDRHGLVYFNPALREDNTEGSREVLEWKRAMDDSRVLLMVVTNDTRSMTSIILAGYYMGQGKDVVLCIQNLPQDGCVINNETLTKVAVKDYNRARVYLTDLANRNQVPVFEDITEAVECAIERCKGR